MLSLLLKNERLYLHQAAIIFVAASHRLRNSVLPVFIFTTAEIDQCHANINTPLVSPPFCCPLFISRVSPAHQIPLPASHGREPQTARATLILMGDLPRAHSVLHVSRPQKLSAKRLFFFGLCLQISEQTVWDSD